MESIICCGIVCYATQYSVRHRFSHALELCTSVQTLFIKVTVGKLACISTYPQQRYKVTNRTGNTAPNRLDLQPPQTGQTMVVQDEHLQPPLARHTATKQAGHIATNRLHAHTRRTGRTHSHQSVVCSPLLLSATDGMGCKATILQEACRWNVNLIILCSAFLFSWKSIRDNAQLVNSSLPYQRVLYMSSAEQ